jgi:membrane-associated phospholipid phosphatase
VIDDLRALPGSRLALLLIALGAVTVVGSLLLIRTGVAEWDERVFVALNTGTGSDSVLARVVSAITTPIGLLVLVLVSGLVVQRTHGWAAVATSSLAAALGWALANGTKLLIDRPRPYESLAATILRQDPARGTSFPSSHTAIVVAVVVALLPILPKPWKVVGIAIVVMVVWSRVYFGVHHPLDLFGGIGVGLVAAGLAWLILGVVARA